MLLLLLVDVIDAEECTGEGCCFTESYEERFVDLSLRIDEDAAEEEYESA